MARHAGLPGALLPALLIATLACRAGGSGSPGGARPPDPGATVLVTASQRAGEEVYRRERCARCHALQETPAAQGPTTLPGPPVAAPGSRVGPDLGSQGHRHSDDWHYAHFYAPAAVVRGSSMPAYRHLFRHASGRPVPLPEAVDLVAYLQALGRGRRDVWAEWRSAEPEIDAPPAAGAPLLARGESLYARLCASCHGASGDGRGEAAGLLQIRPRDFVAGHYRFKSTPAGAPPADADLYRSITLGGGTGAAMPSFYWLPTADRWALVARIKKFSPALAGRGLAVLAGTARAGRQVAGGPERGARAAADGDAARPGEGRRLWEDLGCASCHAAGGEGMTREAAGAGWTDPDGDAVPRSGDLRHACALRGGASPEAIDRAFVLGVGTAMPAYGEALPDGRARRALLAYILSLRAAGRR